MLELFICAKYLLSNIINTQQNDHVTNVKEKKITQ